MSAVVLESEEFAYLLSAVNAVSVAGINDSALFPSDQKSREATYNKGLQLMKEHGWIKPAERPSQFHFDDMLFLMAAVIANPEFVICTADNNGSSGRRVIMHYMTGLDIVELVAAADGKFHIGIVPDRTALFERFRGALDLQFDKQKLQIQFATDGMIIEKIKELATKGKRKQAMEILENLGLGGLCVESLLDALSAAQTIEIKVLKAQKGHLTVGRKAGLFRGKDIAWLIKRLDADSTTLSLETIQADTLPNTLDSFFDSLSQ